MAWLDATQVQRGGPPSLPLRLEPPRSPVGCSSRSAAPLNRCAALESHSNPRRCRRRRRQTPTSRVAIGSRTCRLVSTLCAQKGGLRATRSRSTANVRAPGIHGSEEFSDREELDLWMVRGATSKARFGSTPVVQPSTSSCRPYGSHTTRADEGRSPLARRGPTTAGVSAYTRCLPVRYYLEAAQDPLDVLRQIPTAGRRPSAIARGYYPGVPRTEGGQTIAVAAGQDRDCSRLHAFECFDGGVARAHRRFDRRTR